MYALRSSFPSVDLHSVRAGPGALALVWLVCVYSSRALSDGDTTPAFQHIALAAPTVPNDLEPVSLVTQNAAMPRICAGSIVGNHNMIVNCRAVSRITPDTMPQQDQCQCLLVSECQNVRYHGERNPSAYLVAVAEQGGTRAILPDNQSRTLSDLLDLEQAPYETTSSGASVDP